MNLSRFSIEHSQRLRSNRLTCQFPIKPLHTTPKETYHKQCGLSCRNNVYDSRLCLRRDVFSCEGSSLIEILIVFVMINVMLNLSLGLLVLSNDRDYTRVEIKEGCDIECVIKMDIP